MEHYYDHSACKVYFALVDNLSVTLEMINGQERTMLLFRISLRTAHSALLSFQQ